MSEGSHHFVPHSRPQVAWDGEQLAGRYLSRVGRERLVGRLREALRDPDPTAIDQVLKVRGSGSDG